MYTRYSHLHFYGTAKDFQLQKLQKVPEILLVLDNMDLKRRFQEG